MGVINRECAIPLYKQICDDIIQKIECHELKPGDKIPSETELASQYDVSRMTVRQALNEMLRERVLLRRRGFGTFVAEKIVTRTFHANTVTGFYDEFNSPEYPLRSIVIEKSLVFPQKSVCEQMGIDERTLAVKLTRIRVQGDQPLLVDESYLDKALWDQIKDTDFSEISLFAFLSEIQGVKAETADCDVRAMTASQKIAEHLKISPGTPILKVLMTNRYEDGRTPHVGVLYCPDNMGLKFAIGVKSRV